jgi:LysM repeat protein
MTYTVKAGDSFSKIATRNGLTLAQSLEQNPQISEPNRIKVGDVINLPDELLSTENTKSLFAKEA